MRLLKDKKYIFTIIILTIIFFVSGCKQYEYNDKHLIKDFDIFSQIEDEYYVYFYKDSCPYCNKAYDTINEYLNTENDNKLYVCDITDSVIARIYEGENGQGSQGQYFVDGVSEYTNLYIGGAPSIIKIESGESTYITSGKTNVIEYITNTLSMKLDSFKVKFKDIDGTILKEEIVEKGGNATPPKNPTRKGYIFVNWDKEATNVMKNTIVNAKYEVKAVYDENGLPILTEVGKEYLKKLYHQAYDPTSNIADIFLDKYCGEYNGAEVVKDSIGGADVVVGDRVADFCFYGAHAGDYYKVIYNNKLYRLSEAYENNILTYDDIKEIYRLNALWRAYENTHLYDEYNNKMVLTIYGEQRLKQRLYDNYYKDKIIGDVNDLYIKTYVCGLIGHKKDSYFDVVIADYKGSDYSVGEYTEEVGGYEFIYSDNNTIQVISNNDEVLSLLDAYNSNLLSFDNIETIQHYYNSQYTIDYILSEQDRGLEVYPKRVEQIKQRYLEKFYPNSEYTIDDLEIKEMYCVSTYGLYVAKIINTKDIKEEKLYKINIAGYDIINDENNPILYFHFPNTQSIYNRVIKVEDAYNEGYIERSVLEIINFTQENLYYKNNE